MHVANQIRLLIAAFIILSAATLGIAIAKGFNIALLLKSARWTTHSHEVASYVAEAGKSYTDCETMGRLATIEQNPQKVEGCRKEVAEKLEILYQKVSDNPVQANNVQNIQAAAAQRFQIQDRQISTVQINNGKLESSPTLGMESLLSHNKVLALFTQTELEEKSLLAGRYESLLSTLWRIVYFAAGSILLLIISVSTAFHMTFRALKVRQLSANQMRSASEDTNGDDYIKVPKSEMQNWITLMEQGAE